MFMRRTSKYLLGTFIVMCAILVACAPAPASTTAPIQPTVASQKTWLYAVVPPVVHPFYGPFPGAISDATKAYNLGKVEYQLPQNFVQNEQNQIIDGLVATGYNAFSIQPADPVAGNAKIGELVDAGMLVVRARKIEVR